MIQHVSSIQCWAGLCRADLLRMIAYLPIELKTMYVPTTKHWKPCEHDTNHVNSRAALQPPQGYARSGALLASTRLVMRDFFFVSNFGPWEETFTGTVVLHSLWFMAWSHNYHWRVSPVSPLLVLVLIAGFVVMSRYAGELNSETCLRPQAEARWRSTCRMWSSSCQPANDMHEWHRELLDMD